ncbi:MAG: hypothetical protein ACI8PD_001728, partial [Nitrospinales bacterium]
MFFIIFKRLPVLSCLFFFALPFAVFGQGKVSDSPELAKIFHDSGGKQVAKKIEKQLLVKYSKKITSVYKKIPDEFMDDFFAVMTTDEEIEGLLGQTYSVYEKYFTDDEIKQLSNVMARPIIRKWNKLAPEIAKEQALILDKESELLLGDAAFNVKLEM